MSRILVIATVLSPLLLAPPAFGQDELAANCKVYGGDSPQIQRLEDNSRFYGTADRPASIVCDDMQFFADYAEIFRKQDLVTAQGHVVFVSGGNRIAADRMEFNTKTRTGTFYNAQGSATIGDRGEGTDRSMFGGKEPDAYFWGAEVKKIGPRRYQITRGGFTTCVQPTPRWEISSGVLTMNLDDYVLLKNSVFRVKGVPLMYLPIFYYPIQEDDRATGFLIPTYGASTMRGQTLSNAFFWAINRSHDATVYHDWMSKGGQQLGGEYRYVAAPGSQGDSRFSFIDEKPQTTDGSSSTPGRRSYSLTGNVIHRLPGTFSLRANADYFSSIESLQTYQQDIRQSTRRNRAYGANVAGTLGQYQISATAERRDYFFTPTRLSTTGNLPRFNVSRPERPIGGTPIYFGIGGEYVTLLRSDTNNDVTVSDQGLTRLDVAPTFRVPFNRWPFLGINTTMAWRGTYWTERLAAGGGQIEEGIGRQYFDFQARFVGPVFNKIFNPPDGSDGTKFKHVIQPTFTIQRTTAVDQFDEIVKIDGTDFIRGNVTRLAYGVVNRLYAKKTDAREVLSVAVNQSYYTDPVASQYDPNYQSSFTAARPSNFSPVGLRVITSPTDRVQAEFKTEWDTRAHALRNIAASGTFTHSDWLNGSASWSQRRFIPGLAGFDNPDLANQYLQAEVNLRGFRNRIGGGYRFYYDLKNDWFLEQRIVTYYNAQCCGVAFEYQSYNLLGSFVQTTEPKDRRFNISFTLAGIGTFSNLFGAFGGQQGR